MSMPKYLFDDKKQRDYKVAHVHYQWTAGEVCFDCPCGETEIIMGEGGDVKQCDCGRVYRLRHYVEVDETECQA